MKWAANLANRARFGGALLASATATWLLWMTQRPQGTVTTELAPVAESAGALGIAPGFFIDKLGNVAVFVPLGLGAALALPAQRRWQRIVVATLVGSLLSAGIELLQLAQPTRYATVTDWLLNTLGTALGAALAVVVLKQLSIMNGKE